MKLIYKIGDVTKPEESTPIIIPHCVNDCVGGVMGSGVARALFKKWYKVKTYYHDWAANYTSLVPALENGYSVTGPFRLGEIQTLKVEDGIYVANMVGQRDICDFEGIPPIRYEAIRDCLINLRNWLSSRKRRFNVCAPKFGSELAGGHWPDIEDIIYEVFDDTVFDWTIYSLK